MSTYFFIFGSHPRLSLFELLRWLNHQKLDGEVILFEDNFMVLQSKHLAVEQMATQLGGIVKCGILLHETKITPLSTFLQTECSVVNLTEHYLPMTERKIKFGLSLYPMTLADAQKNRAAIQDWGLAVKKQLKERGINARFVVSREPVLSSVVVKKNHLLDQGAEVVILRSQEKIFAGRTLAVQPFAAYSFRDYGRPYRDQVAGMLPPKLAQMMINFAQVNTSELLVDPFCGSGTILQEALLMGYRRLIGIDASSQAVSNAERNMQWLMRELKMQIEKFKNTAPNLELKIQKAPVTRLSEVVEPNSVGAIITEPYLGPPFRGTLSREKFQMISLQLTKLYLQSFPQFYQVLKTGGKVVIIFPVFRRQQWEHLHITEDIIKLGFTIKPFVFGEIKERSLLYARPDQHLAREIFVFVKS